MISKLSYSFTLPGDSLPETTYLEYHILTMDKKPIYVKLYKYLPVLLGPDGKIAHRIVFDYRKLNEKTIPDAYPLPNIQ